MNLPFFIAGRYLFAKKSHNVINIISAISSIGMAIGTAALIIILSVFNGFDSLVKSANGNVEPDILVTPAKGKVFVPDSAAFAFVYDDVNVKNMCCILEENVYINYDQHSGLAKAKGVDIVYEEESPIQDHIVDGKYQLHKGDIPMAVVGASLAYSMGISPRFLEPMEIYFPSRTRKFSFADAMSSIERIKIWPSGIFSINNAVDNDLVILPIEKMRQLLGYTEEVSGVEIRMVNPSDKKTTAKLIKEISERLGEDYKVYNRYQQNESLYKMMQYEKVSVYLILVFVIIIIAFNIFGSLSMLIIEKRGDIRTLRAMGAKESLIEQIFILEGWMISLLGLACGIVIGLVFAFIQQQFGIIKMPGNFMTTAYPVIIQVSDVIITGISVAVIGLIIAILPVKSLKNNH